MEIKNFTITKRDGGKDRFSMDKIMNAIIKAFDSVNEPIDLGNVSKLISRLNIYNNIKVEDIQNQVEEALMAEGFFKECPITFRDIALAKVVLTERLKSIYHTRISYPHLNK